MTNNKIELEIMLLETSGCKNIVLNLMKTYALSCVEEVLNSDEPDAKEQLEEMILDIVEGHQNEEGFLVN